MSPQRRKYFGIIVHYGDPKITEKLVDDIQSSLSSFDKVIIIDHGPQSDRLTHGSENIQILRPSQNSGYAGGIEVGIGALFAAKAKPDDIVTVMNNDIHIGERTIENIKKWWERHSEPVIAGAKMGNLELKSGRTSLSRRDDRSSNISYLHGSIFSAPYHIMQNLRVPQNYFMYWEDVFFSNYAKTKGIKLATIDEITVDHEDTKKSPTDDHLYYLVRNGALFLEKETPPSWRKYWWARNRLRLLYHTFPNKNPRRHIVRKALSHAVRGKSGQVQV